MVQELVTDERAAPHIEVYDANTIARVTQDAPPNGYTFLMMPGFSEVHLAYGKDAPRFKNLFDHPIIGWVTGIHLNDLGKEKPKVFNGKTGEVFPLNTRSEEHTSELQSLAYLVCRLLLEKKKKKYEYTRIVVIAYTVVNH